jgi:hypothetical protein
MSYCLLNYYWAIRPRLKWGDNLAVDPTIVSMETFYNNAWNRLMGVVTFFLALLGIVGFLWPMWLKRQQKAFLKKQEQQLKEEFAAELEKTKAELKETTSQLEKNIWEAYGRLNIQQVYIFQTDYDVGGMILQLLHSINNFKKAGKDEFVQESLDILRDRFNSITPKIFKSIRNKDKILKAISETFEEDTYMFNIMMKIWQQAAEAAESLEGE